MCDFGAVSGPMIAAIVAATAAAASTTVGVVSSIQQGKAAQAQYDYEAQVAAQNAKIASQNAATERQTGLEEARRQRIRTLQAIGEQKAGLAANGVDVGYGTSLDIIEDTAMLGELDALTIQYNAERRARNYDLQETNFYNDATLSRFAGQNASKAASIGALGTAISGVGQIAGSFSGGFGKLGTTTSTASDVTNAAKNLTTLKSVTNSYSLGGGL